MIRKKCRINEIEVTIEMYSYGLYWVYVKDLKLHYTNSWVWDWIDDENDGQKMREAHASLKSFIEAYIDIER